MRQKDRRDIDAYGHRFVARTDSEGREGYVLRDTLPNSPHTEIATIYPSDPRQPVHSGNNAALYTCDYGTGTLELHSINGLGESLRRAVQHADRHREHYRDAEVIRRAAEVNFADLRAAEQSKEQAPQTFKDRVKARLAKSREQPATKQRNRDQGRERD